MKRKLTFITVLFMMYGSYCNASSDPETKFLLKILRKVSADQAIELINQHNGDFEEPVTAAKELDDDFLPLDMPVEFQLEQTDWPELMSCTDTSNYSSDYTILNYWKLEDYSLVNDIIDDDDDDDETTLRFTPDEAGSMIGYLVVSVKNPSIIPEQLNLEEYDASNPAKNKLRRSKDREKFLAKKRERRLRNKGLIDEDGRVKRSILEYPNYKDYLK